MSTCPSASSATSTSRSVRSDTLTASATFSPILAPSAATSAGSNWPALCTSAGSYARSVPPGRAPLCAQRLHAKVAPLQLWVGGQLLGGQLGGDLARDHHQLALGDGGGHPEVLLDQQDADALLRQPEIVSTSSRRSSARAPRTARP